MLTIKSGFPTDDIFTEIIFDVEGVTNPRYAGQTGAFKVDSYDSFGNSAFTFLESSDATIVATPTAGSLSGESLTLADPTVGSYSTMTVAMTTVHDIPQDGKIELEFPKWNYFADSQSKMTSYVATSTSPGSVPCNSISNIPVLSGTELNCMLSHGNSVDTLTVLFDEYLSSRITGGTTLSFSIEGVRAPPTTSVTTGFALRTSTKDGDVID